MTETSFAGSTMSRYCHRTDAASHYRIHSVQVSANKCPHDQALDGYNGLRGWRGGIILLFAVHRLTVTFPPTERFGLSSQIQRAAMSIPSSIAEGYGRSTTDEFRLFLGHASDTMHPKSARYITTTQPSP